VDDKASTLVGADVPIGTRPDPGARPRPGETRRGFSIAEWVAAGATAY